ncbi:MAG: hypothetical protein M0P66_00570 [Salinivirgaceae bacterium]|nr:hypothetical protein [Salinivirgaceae bacterium]
MIFGPNIAKRFVGWVLFQTLALATFAQFYNGHQMTFGKSRVQYNDFYWQYYRFPKFDTYFYVSGSQLASYVSEIAGNELEYIEYSLEEILQRRIIFIVYNKQSEFRQSNIGLVTGAEDYNIGGVTRIIDNKVFLYYEGDHVKLKRQIRASITEILINEMLYGGSFRDRVSSSTMLNLPEWFIPGLISYMAYDLDFETEVKIKNAILEGKVQKIHRMHGENAKIAGHAFWRYLAETYGPEIVPQIVYMTRISKSVESGFLYVLGMPLKEALSDWFYYHQTRYTEEQKQKEEHPASSVKVVKRTNRKKVYQQVKMSPDGNYISYVTNQDGQYAIWLYNTQTRRTKKILRRENKLEQITDYSYPLLAWHPTSKVLTYIYERKGLIWLDFYTLETGETVHRELFYLDKVLDYSYSPDGQQLVMSGVIDGFTDVFIYSLAASTFNRITNDLADDLNPGFSEGSSKIIFASNRKTNLLNDNKEAKPEIQNNFDLFVYNTSEPTQELQRLTDTWNVDEWAPKEFKRQQFFYLSDQNGIINRGFSAFDSTISFIDTSIHYRIFTKHATITNRAFSIQGFDYNQVEHSFTDVSKGVKRYSLINYDWNPDPALSTVTVPETWFRNYHDEQYQLDSLMRNPEAQNEPDSLVVEEIPEWLNDTLIDINNYVFEVEKQAIKFTPDEKKPKVFTLPKQLVYFTNFYSNLLVTQVDFGFMNQSYQAFTGSAFYFNPGFNVLMKIGANDLFEDYKITGGIRFSVDFESNEYLVSVENLKKRLDKQYIYHRQVFESLTESSFSKIFTNEVMAVYKYPFSQIHALRTTASLRYDEQVYKSIDANSLKQPNDHKIWAGLKSEFIVDNVRGLGLNLWDGSRMKFFGEYYNQLGSGYNSHLFVVGADIRNYLPIHRDLVFASRLAWSTSFGNSLLIYYLGGVDNWMNFSSNTPTFDQSVNINEEKNWVYQAVATNMRGFVQNVRNGNSFAVTNLELRWPIIRYVFNRPISSDFFNNFMVIGFTDIGSAWEGWNPINARNAYDYEELNQSKPIRVVIDRKHYPLVAGVGFGLRSRFLGYYIRTDWAWGIDGGRVLPRVFYLSLCTDF